MHTQLWKATSTTSRVSSACSSMCRRRCRCPSAAYAWRAERYADCQADKRLSKQPRLCYPAAACVHLAAITNHPMQVFISEQVLYSKQDLERHQRQGDLTGPLAESGFKGHPNCR